MRKLPLTEYEIDLIVEYYKKFGSINAVRRELGFNSKTVRKYLSQRGEFRKLNPTKYKTVNGRLGSRTRRA